MKQQYRLHDKARDLTNESRRGFMKATGALSGALVIGFSLPTREAEAKAASPHVANAWVKVDNKGKVTLICHRSEMGQGVYTSMPMLVAEELGVPLSAITVEMAPSAPVYINAMLGGQITGGSTSVRDAWMKLREAGASARTVLVAAAADNWKVSPSECKVANGRVMHGSKSATYGSLVGKASTMKMPEKVALKDPKDWTIIGKQKARIDTPAKVYGKAQFGIDVKKPGMLVASLAQAPVIGGKAVKVNDAKAKAVKGVVQVVQIPDGVAVLAKDFYTAKKGRDALEIEWDNGPNAGLDMLRIEQDLRTASLGNGAIMRKDGAGADQLSAATSKVEAEYILPFLAHATLEPVNCTAEIKNGECHITGPIQFQQGAQFGVAAAIKMPPEKVFIHTTFLGGGYGRKLELDFQIQAAQISQAIGGKPVKLVWTREDDMKHDFYRPMSLHQMAAGLDAQGNVQSLHFKMISPSVTARAFPPVVKDGKDPFMAEGTENLTYKVPNLAIENVIHDTGIRVGYWRSVSNALNAFAVESFMDEIAVATKKDPVALRMSLLAHDPRSQNVLKLAAERAGWGKAPQGRALGVAQMECYGTHSAVVAEVSMSKDGPKVHKLTCVVDCGIVVHPDQAMAQMESGMLLGFSSGMWDEITFKDGAVEQSNFHDYPMLRMSQVPQMDITFVQSSAAPGGLGEVGVPLVMPAIANALASLNGGKRVRRMPLAKNV
jgi:isoquinoline 1-oxidoreductase subunit beta